MAKVCYERWSFVRGTLGPLRHCNADVEEKYHTAKNDSDGFFHVRAPGKLRKGSRSGLLKFGL
jgi:hypothetical protein